jgi:NAD(P)-dependent dehydrogenase (short-subunit alcohol dehydrogenase family)
MRSSAGHVALVTGGSRGIGYAVAARLARSGLRVAIAARSASELGAAAAGLASGGGSPLAVPVDVSVEADVSRLVGAVEQELGPVDLLVNNAATCLAVGPLAASDPQAWWRDVEIGLRGPFLCTRAVLPSMTARGAGRIVNVVSAAANRPAPLMTGYAAAKAALVHLTSSLAAEVRDTGISAFAVAPGTVRTRLTEGLLATEDGRRCLGRTDPDSWFEADRAADLVSFIASGRADVLSGRFLHVLDDVEALVREARAGGSLVGVATSR